MKFAKLHRPEEVSESDANEAANRLNQCMKDFSELNLDADFAAYLLLTMSMSLLILNNRKDPVAVTELLALAMHTANESVAAHDEEGETKH